MSHDPPEKRDEPGLRDTEASSQNTSFAKPPLAMNSSSTANDDRDVTHDFDPGSSHNDASDIVFSGLSLIEDETVPPNLGKYTIQSRIGCGGMGVVFKGTDPDLHRTVAIKVLGPHLSQSLVARRRFQREARAAAAISHPNVLTIHSVEEHQRTPFLVMEYVSGMSLKEYVLSKGKLEPMEVIRLSAQIAQGLAAAHAQGVIHRDVKPGNVMLHDGAVRARIMDFGLARAAFDNADLTSNDHRVGTPAYMAPEQIRGDNTDARADLFSLGSVIYFMLIGYAPFSGRTQAETIHKILDTTPRLQNLDPSIPPVLSDIAGKLLQKDPDARYQSALEVADVLNRLLTQLNQAGTGEMNNVLYQKLPVSPEPDEKVPQRKLSELSHRTPFRWMQPLVTIAIVGMFALAGGFAWWNHWPARPAPTGGVSAVDVPAHGDRVLPQAKEAVPELLAEITVGPESRFKSINEALKVIAPTGTITVVGPGPYSDQLKMRGDAAKGVTLRAKPRARLRVSGASHILAIENAAGIVVEGFDFDCEGGNQHGIDVSRTVEGLTIRDCTFLHSTDAATRSLLAIRCQSKQADSVIWIHQCRFESNGGAFCVSADCGAFTVEKLVVEGCHFSAPYTQFFATQSCRRLKLAGNVFVGGTNAINLDIQSWSPESRIEIVNNTFSNTKHWLGFVNSFRSTSVPKANSDSRVCNNLILKGESVQGGMDQFQVVANTWTIAKNWWERDDTTILTNEMGGQLATLQSQLQIPIRNDPSLANYLVPQPESPLLTSGCGGDLPEYIGAKGPLASR